MSARDTIADAIAFASIEHPEWEFSLPYADRVLAALAADGYVIVRREQVGFLCHVCGLRAGTGTEVGDHGKFCSVAGARRPVYVDVEEAS